MGKSTSVTRVKIRALTVKYSIFQKWQELLFNNAITQFLDWPFNEGIIRAKPQKYGHFTGNFLKKLVCTGVPVFIRAGSSH